MEQYGSFGEIINKLESSLSEVRAFWEDQTALTYDHINENMKYFATKIWSYRNNSVAGYDAVKANYNENEFYKTLNELNHKISTV